MGQDIGDIFQVTKENVVSKDRFVAAMTAMAEEVWEFHNRFGIGSGMFADTDYTLPDIVEKRKHLLSEEIQELRVATSERNDDYISDEASDVLFVAMGNIEALGYDGIKGAIRVTLKNGNKTVENHAMREDTGKLLPKEGKPHKWK